MAVSPRTSPPHRAVPRRRRRWPVVVTGGLAAVAVAVAAALLISGGEDGDPQAPDEGTDAQVVAPLTGVLVDGPLRPALMVKIDNVEAARPQSGLGAADVVVESMVEGGLTRLAAIYSATDPGTVGPIRSVRLTDLRVAALLGRPAMAFSGGAEPVLAEAQDAADAGTVVLVSADTDPDAFSRDDDRPRPHNLYAEAEDLWAAAPDAEAPAPLFAFGDAAGPAIETSGFEVVFPSVRVGYRWDGDRRAWIRSQDGTPVLLAETGDALGVENVVVLRVEYGASPHDERSPVADLSAGGDAWVFRDGAMTACRWSTSTSAIPRIDLRAADGSVCAITPGHTWVELAVEPPAT